MTLSDQLKDAIEQSGMSQYAISQATGVSSQAISRFVRGERSLNLESANILAEFFQMRLTAPKKPKLE